MTAHNVRIRQDPGWATGTAWQSSEQTALDAAVNGDGGGTWSPTANITIRGAGLRLVGTTHTFSGPISQFLTDGSFGYVQHNDSDYMVLGPGHAGKSLAMVSPVARAVSAAGWGVVPILPSLGVLSPFQILSSALGATARVPLEVHDAATFSLVQFPYAVQGTSVIPAQLPRFGVFAIDTSGNKYPLSPAHPYQSPTTPNTVADWVNSGVQRIFTFECDPTTPYAKVDKTRYSYVAEIVECSGVGAVPRGVYYGDVSSVYTGIADLRPR